RARVGRRVLHRNERQAPRRRLRPAAVTPRAQAAVARGDGRVRGRRRAAPARRRRAVRVVVQEDPVKRVLVVAALLLSAFAARVDVASATSECRGFMTCVPVAGPWVVVPVSARTQRPQVQYQLTCPKGFIVGGVDAELSDRATEVWFLGSPGSPVAPGRST